METFDLGRAIATAESIKGMKRQTKLDQLREQAMQGQIRNQEQAGEIAAAQEGRDVEKFTTEQRLLGTRTAAAAFSSIEADPSAENIERWKPELDKAGVQIGDYTKATPEQIKSFAGRMKTQFGTYLDTITRSNPKFAEMDAEHKLRLEEISAMHASRLGEIQATGKESRITADSKPGREFRPLSQEEVKAAGLPPGTSAQIDDTTGKIDVLSKRDSTGNLSQKDQTTAKLKLNNVKLARQQLNNIRASFKSGIKGINAFGPGAGRLPTEAGKKFDAAVDQMRSTLTSLTRVPGVGAMSDYETRLDQAKFPDRTDYEGVTEEKINGIENMLSTIETGYRDLLSGAETPDIGQSDPLGIR